MKNIKDSINKAKKESLKLTKMIFKKKTKDKKPKIILKILFPLKNKIKERGKSKVAKIEKLFGVPIVLKATLFEKEKGKIKIL